MLFQRIHLLLIILSTAIAFSWHPPKKLKKEKNCLGMHWKGQKQNLIDNPNIYFEVLNNYAGYLRENKIDNSRSIECYRECLDYLKNNDRDPFLKTAVYTGYSKSLQAAGEFEECTECHSVAVLNRIRRL